MIDQKKRKLNEKDFLFDIPNRSSQDLAEPRKELDEKIEKLTTAFAESSQRKKLLRL